MTSPPQRCDGGRTTRKRSASSVSEKSPDGGSTGTRATLPSSSATYRQSTLASFFSTPASPRPNSRATSNVSVPTFVNATPALSSSATPPVASTSNITTVLERISTGTVRELVVTHKDRLARFGVELVEWICRQHETMLVVLGDVEVPADEDELRDDQLAVTTFFVARDNGRRSAENRKRRKAQEQEDHQHEDASEHSEEDSSQPNKGTRSPAHLVDAHQSMDVQPGGGVQTRVEEGAPRALCQ